MRLGQCELRRRAWRGRSEYTEMTCCRRREEVARCVVTDVLDLARGAGLLGTWAADGLFMSAPAAI